MAASACAITEAGIACSSAAGCLSLLSEDMA
jgi:hypothetical protein